MAPRQGSPREEPIVITDAMVQRRATAAVGRRDFEAGMGYFQPFTLALILALVGTFVWEVASGALTSRESVTAAGALVRARVFDGEAWRLVTAGFLHGGPDHLIGNIAALYIVGMGCEHAFGSAKTLVLFMASELAGSVLSVLMHPGPSVGASGAIFGLMGALTVVLVRWRSRFHVRDMRISAVVAGWAAYALLMGALDPWTDNAAHVGGLIAGSLLALGFRPSAMEPRGR